jgi:ArsR family transcriptional regulator
MMDETRAAEAFSALGHPVRLQLYRLLIRANPEGARVSDIGAHLGINGATLTHHLSTLVQAGLVTQQRKGREIINRADMAAMQQISDFMVEQCCLGLEDTEQPPQDESDKATRQSFTRTGSKYTWSQHPEPTPCQTAPSSSPPLPILS